jgi:aspartate aminotransferase
MVELPVDDVEAFCKWCLTDFTYAIENPQGEGERELATVMMAPGTGFYTNPEEGRHQVRMAYVLCKEDLAKATLVLRKALEAYNNPKS